MSKLTMISYSYSGEQLSTAVEAESVARVDSHIVQMDSQLSTATEARAVDQTATIAAHESGNLTIVIVVVA